jgi:pyruvyltransferase
VGFLRLDGWRALQKNGGLCKEKIKMRWLMIACSAVAIGAGAEGLPLYYWQQKDFVNFGDFLSVQIVEKIVNEPVAIFRRGKTPGNKLLAVGSMLYFASDGDVIWGTGVNGKQLDPLAYQFHTLDIRAVRGPLTRRFIMENFHIDCPAVYGDPALLLPCLFPEFKRQERPRFDYLVIYHYKERFDFPRKENVVFATDPWDEIVRKICDSRFVISSSLHGIIVAEAFGIPARMLRVAEYEPLFKYADYYAGTGRWSFDYATSVEEALEMGGESPARCDLRHLYEAFPFEYWPSAQFTIPRFEGRGCW